MNTGGLPASCVFSISSFSVSSFSHFRCPVCGQPQLLFLGSHPLGFWRPEQASHLAQLFIWVLGSKSGPQGCMVSMRHLSYPLSQSWFPELFIPRYGNVFWCWDCCHLLWYLFIWSRVPGLCHWGRVVLHGFSYFLHSHMGSVHLMVIYWLILTTNLTLESHLGKVSLNGKTSFLQ